jgi:hypothetical protein
MKKFAARGGELITNAGKSRVLAAEGKAWGSGTQDGAVYAADKIVVACSAATPSVRAASHQYRPTGQ